MENSENQPEPSSKLLKSKFDLHKSPEVDSAVTRSQNITGEKVPQDPLVRIQTYLNRFREITDRQDPQEREHGLDAAKRLLHSKFVIKSAEVPEAYFDNQKRIAREQGHGDIDITKEMRDQLTEVIIADQRSSLDKWVDYLSSSDAPYPDALKYFTLRSVLSIGEYDKEKHAFTTRSKGTVKPFPDLNREALAYVLDVINKKYSKQIIIDLENLDEKDRAEFEKLLQGENFAKLYAWGIEKVTPASQEALADTRGEWVKYPQNSDHMPLVTSLQGHGTGWCTAGESTAEVQLKNGDFYVYYSLDQDGKPTIPRTAIRMEGNKIGEVRGVAPEQNLDPYISDVVSAKMEEFPDGKLYQKKSADMKYLTAIENKTKKGQELTIEDILFLYEVKAPIEGFGYGKDPRIGEITAERDLKTDLSFALDVPRDRISTNEDEALKGNILFHHGNLNLSSLTTTEGLTLPQTVIGNLNLGSLTTTEGLILPETISGDLSLNSLFTAEGLKLPEIIGGDLSLESLTTAEGLILPQTIGGDLNLRSLTSAEGLTLPQTVSGGLDLYSLTTAEGLILPQTVGGDLFLLSLTTAEKDKLRNRYPAFDAKIE